MEQSDAALGGQDDMFELNDASKALKGERSGAGYDESSEEEGGDDEEEEDDEVLDSEEERERKVAGLEEELDGLYDAYREHLKERDAKYRVKEARKNNKMREETWKGIGNDDESDDSDAEVGGYERVQRAKARIGEHDSDSSDDSSDEESAGEDSRLAGKKRRRVEGLAEGSSKNKKARTVGKLEEPKSTPSLSRSAQLWFDQDIFTGAGDNVEDVEEDEDDEEEEEEEEVVSGEEGEEVRPTFLLLLRNLMSRMLGRVGRR